MFDFDMSLLPTAIDITLYKYNYIDNKLWAQLINQTDYIEIQDDTIILSASQIRVFIEHNYRKEINKFKSIGADVLHTEVNSIYFLYLFCDEMENLQFVKITLNSKKQYSRLVDFEDGKMISFSFKILSATLRLTDLFSGVELEMANRALENFGIIEDGVPYVRIQAKELNGTLSVSIDDEDPDSEVLLDILDILEQKMEKDNTMILLITDY